MSVKVWDQASGQNHVLQVENQVLILHSYSKRPTHPALSCASWQMDNRIVNCNTIVNW